MPPDDLSFSFSGEFHFRAIFSLIRSFFKLLCNVGRIVKASN